MNTLDVETELNRFKNRTKAWKKAAEAAGDPELFIILIDMIHGVAKDILDDNREPGVEFHEEQAEAWKEEEEVYIPFETGVHS
jgi:hypothetical protein